MIVPFFPPNAGGGVHRPLAFVKYLREFGWNCTVVTPEAGSFWITDNSLLDEIPPSCEVHRTRSLSGQALLGSLRKRSEGSAEQVRSSGRFAALRRLGSWVTLPDTYVGWRPFATSRALRLLRGRTFDAIYSTSPPETSHLIAGTLQRRSGLPWVADFRDPWMNLHLFHPPTPLHRWLHTRMERGVCRRARVVVTSTWHAELLQRRYPGMAPPVVIPNGYDHVKFEPVRDLRPPEGTFVMTHTGMLTQKRSAVPLLDGLQLFLREKPDARIRVQFVGPRESANDAAVTERGLDSVVEFRDTVSHSESLRIEKTSHILLLIKHADPVYRRIVPGKLFEYVGACRPVLALVPEGAAADIVRRLRRGEVVPLDDPAQVARVIGALYDRYDTGTLDQEYDLSVVEEFQRKGRTRSLAQLLDSLKGAGA